MTICSDRIAKTEPKPTCTMKIRPINQAEEEKFYVRIRCAVRQTFLIRGIALCINTYAEGMSV